jgi:hypothetical protein
MAEQAGRILHLINNDGRRMTAKKTARFLLRLFRFSGEVKGYKGMVREKTPKRGCFAGLSGSSEHDYRPRLRGALQPGFNSP